jgi:hypothetical protein
LLLQPAPQLPKQFPAGLEDGHALQSMPFCTQPAEADEATPLNNATKTMGLSTRRIFAVLPFIKHSSTAN